MNNFSSTNRKQVIAKAKNEVFDLLIIGGGITGAGIALDAAMRGLSVILVEKNDFASGTSSKSTKLIHGGLRYLKQMELRLVNEVGSERAIVHKNAPHIVIPEKMLLPIKKNGSLSYNLTSLALWIYDFLAGVKSSESRKMLSKEKTKKIEPLLKGKNLQGGGLYYEYRTDDARLTIEALKKAAEYSANCTNYTEVLDFVYKDEKIIGAKVHDSFLDKEYQIKAKKVVNATGPWVDLLRTKDASLSGKRLQLTKGVHLVIDYKKLPVRQAIYFDVGDGRMIFAIPRSGKTYLGTTDTVFNEDLNRPLTSKADIAYLLKAINTTFSKTNLKESDIESSWSGLRPLIHEDGKSASELSRKDEIFYGESGLISIAGGKLTGYRKMAERIVNIVTEQLQQEEGKKYTVCKTEFERLAGGNFANQEEITDYIIYLTGKAREIKLTIEHIKEWVYRYGSNTEKILDIAIENNQNRKDIDLLAICSELHYCIDNEMVTTISDFLIRRSSRLYFDRPRIKYYIDELQEILVQKLLLSEAQSQQQKADFMERYQDSRTFV
ncbi:MAG: glycerol-3-phosphate dehydrogenase/oxidase [Chitinophagales bacterium]